MYRSPHPSRRTVLKAGAGAFAMATAGFVVPRPLLADLGNGPEPVPPIDDPRLKQLTTRALDTARSGGASYADVRLSHTRDRAISDQNINDGESMTVGVRALVNGYWGFASSPVWTPDEMVRLARAAVDQAKTNALGKPRETELAPVSAANGNWVMPIAMDAFEIHPMEIQDFLASLKVQAERIPYAYRAYDVIAIFTVQDKVFASTAESYCVQRTYCTRGDYSLMISTPTFQGSASVSHLLTPAGMGYELMRGQDLPTLLAAEVERTLKDHELPYKAVDVGRFDTVFDARTMASVLSGSIGAATQLDRAMGYEANATGTSYLSEPLEMLGVFPVGGPLLTVTSNRAEAGGVKTVRWDDEGVEPDTVTLVKNGILHDYQTTRESATWLSSYYTKQGMSVRSHGSATAPAAVDAPMHHTGNLVMAPGKDDTEFDTLVASVNKGLAFRSMTMFMDFQQVNGFGMGGQAYEIKNGKRVANIINAGTIFRAPEFWKNLTAIGGPRSSFRTGLLEHKGQPAQQTWQSVTAVPALVKDSTIIDIKRKA